MTRSHLTVLGLSMFLAACAHAGGSPSPAPPACTGTLTSPDSVSTDEAEIANRQEIVRAMTREYPALQDRPGIEKGQHTAYVRMVFGPDGRVSDARIRTSSGSSELDAVALRVARVYRFAPVVRGGCAVAAWVVLPITFQIA